MRCPSCRFAIWKEDRFCRHCGTQLASAEEAPAAERRQLTVMFCDLVGSTSLSGRLDPEDLREVVRAYQQTCAEVIQQFGGHTAQYLGDGLLVYFGFPRAHEDNPQRAVRSGLGILEALAELNVRLERDKGIELSVRIGIHTGLVVVGEVGGGRRREQLALGATPNVAARIQGIAKPDTLAVSQATQRLIASSFELGDLGPQELRGVAEPVPVYEVIRKSISWTRSGFFTFPRSQPMIGRDKELASLADRWRDARSRAGSAVLVLGEAGIGKSRLIKELRESLPSHEYSQVVLRCSPYHRQSSLYPMIDFLERELRFDGATPAERLERLRRSLTARRLDREDLPLFTSLLSLPSQDVESPSSAISARKKRQLTRQVLVRWILAQARELPVLWVVEDLHWVDPTTLDLLRSAVDQIVSARILLLMTCRLPCELPWRDHPLLRQLTLGRLDRSHVERMILQVAGGESLPGEVMEQLAIKTDGVPLFIEELTRTVLESGWLRRRGSGLELVGSLPSLAIPETVRDSLMARLDRLAEARELAQLAATLGREFTYRLIHTVATSSEARLKQGLRALVKADLLHQRGLPPHSRYSFKHALLQDAAYHSLLRSLRQRYHRRIAKALETQFPEVVDAQPELVANHLTQAGLLDEAVGYWRLAGEMASRRSANAEAIDHFTTGLELIRQLAETKQRVRQELLLNMELGAARSLSDGHGAEKVEEAYFRAWELCQKVGDVPELFPVLYGLFMFYFTRGEARTATDLSKQLWRLASLKQEPEWLMAAYHVRGMGACVRGELSKAREHFERATASYRGAGEKPADAAMSFARVGSIAYAGWILWWSGYPDRAVSRMQVALALAVELADPFCLATVHTWVAMLHHYRREPRLVWEKATAAAVQATDQGYQVAAAMALALRGWAGCQLGTEVDGLALVRRGLAAWRAAGVGSGEPYLLLMLAETLAGLGQPEAGLAALDDALVRAEQIGERVWQPELHRLQGELLLLSGSDEAIVDGCFLAALQLARRHGSRSLELRAAVSRARLCKKRSEAEETRRDLLQLYGSFGEGFDTADLRCAAALLD